jgi:hypothetical protein
MEIIEVNTSDRQQVRWFTALPFDLYKGTQQWVPPLSTDAVWPLKRNKNPFYRDGDAIFLLAIDSGRPVGRVAVLDNHRYNQFNNQRAAFFYFFECADDLPLAKALFERGFSWAKSRGLEHIIGPKGFTVFDGLGMLVKGFEHRPAFGQPYNLPYYPGLVESLGFESKGELVSGYLDQDTEFPQKIHHIADKLKVRRGLSVIHCETRRELRKVISKLKDIYNASLGGTEGNLPLTDEEVNSLTSQLLWFADPKLIKLVMKDAEVIGFLLAYPDISSALQRTRGKLFPFGWISLLLELRRTTWININGAGISDQYRGTGGTAILFSEMYKSVVDSRYRFAEVVQIGSENENMQREMRNFGIDFYKTHRLYARCL